MRRSPDCVSELWKIRVAVQMGNELGLWVPGVRSSGNTARMAQKLGKRRLKKGKPMDTRRKVITREIVLGYALFSFYNSFAYDRIFQPMTPFEVQWPT